MLLESLGSSLALTVGAALVAEASAHQSLKRIRGAQLVCPRLRRKRGEESRGSLESQCGGNIAV